MVSLNYLGLDIGTGACKAVVFNGAGRRLAEAGREYELRFTPEGGAELDSDLVVSGCMAVMADAARQVEPRTIRAIGISSQGEAFTAIDSDGRALCNAMVSSDTRSASYARRWPAEFGAEKLYQITGHTAHPMFTLFKLLWLREARPDVWSRSWKFLCFEDLLQYRLGLAPAIGWPLAGRTMLFDVRRHAWSSEILDRIGISADKLARPLPSGAVAGRVALPIADELGLAPETLVVCGGHDQPCGALGAGVTEPGIAMYSTGSVECITPAFSSAIFTNDLRDNNLCTYDHAAPGMYTTVAFSLTGGNLLKWFRDEFGMADVEAAGAAGVSPYDMLLRSASRSPTDLLVLPYFTPSGTPHFDTSTRGAILGLRLSTKRGELLRALLEGVALEMRLNLNILAESGCVIRELRAIGGGARSEFWTQLKADVVGMPITTMDVTEAGCLGVAMLACAAATNRSVTEIAGDWIKPLKKHVPSAEFTRIYDSKFAAYAQLYPALKRLAVV